MRAGSVDLSSALPAQRVAGPADGPTGANHVIHYRHHLAVDIEVLRRVLDCVSIDPGLLEVGEITTEKGSY